MSNVIAVIVEIPFWCHLCNYGTYISGKYLDYMKIRKRKSSYIPFSDILLFLPTLGQ